MATLLTPILNHETAAQNHLMFPMSQSKSQISYNGLYIPTCFDHDLTDISCYHLFLLHSRFKDAVSQRGHTHSASGPLHWLFHLPGKLPQVSSLITFRSLLKHHLSLEPSLVSLSKTATTPKKPHSSSLFYFSNAYYQPTYFNYTCLAIYCLPSSPTE